jgi:hypothetical protein
MLNVVMLSVNYVKCELCSVILSVVMLSVLILNANYAMRLEEHVLDTNAR